MSAPPLPHRRAFRGRRLLLPVTAALSVACRDPTQVTVRITTDLDCPEVRGTAITNGKLGAIEDVPFATETDRCDVRSGDDEVGTIVLFPSADDEARFGVKIVTGVRRPAAECAPPAYDGCIVARRGLKFAPHTPLVLPIVMRESCLDVECDPQTTCVRGECVSATVDVSDCKEPRGCGEDVLPRRDGGADGASGAGGAAGAAAAAGDSGPPDASSGGTGGAPDAATAGAGGADAPNGGSGGNAGAGGVDAGGGASGAPGDASSDVTDAPLPCVAPTGDCNGVASDGCETDLSSDSAHCGRCARDCLGGACTAGACASVTVAPAFVGSPWEVTADATHMYWTENMPGAVGRALPDGSSRESLGTGLGSLRGLAVDGTHVYFAFHDVNGSIQRVPRAGGTIETFAANEPWPLRVVADATHIYWSCYQNAGRIRRAPKMGGPAETLATETQTWGLALDASTVYFTTWRTGGGVFSVPKSGGPSTLLTTSPRPPASVAVLGSTAFFTRYQGMTGDVVTVPATAGTSTVLVAGEGNPFSIAADASGTYWTNNGSGQVRHLGPSPSPATLAAALNGPKNLWLAPDSVYFTTADEVRRVAKP